MANAVWLYLHDAGTPNECWMVCSKGDPGAILFVPYNAVEQAYERGQADARSRAQNKPGDGDMGG